MQRATKDKDNNRDNNRSSNSSSSNYNNNTNLEAVNQQQYQYQHHHNLQHQKTEGFLGSFLSKGLKTNQLVVNTDEKTLRPIARLKEPRDLFALPKDKDNDCSQQAPRWPVECQVIEERITHIPYVPAQPEPLNMPTGNELKPRPVGEENGIVVFSYNPISAVNYEKPKAKKNDDSSDESDYSSDSHIDSTPPSRSTPVRQQAVGKQPPTVSKMINNLDNRSTSVSLDEDNDFEDDYDYDTSGGTNSGEAREKAIIKDLIEAKKKRYAAGGSKCTSKCSSKAESSKDPSSEIDDIWKNNSTEYKPASPRYVLSQFGRKVSKAIIEKMCDNDDKTPNSTGVGGSGGTSNKVPKSKYAVAPIKLPKSNIARLEQAFRRSAHSAREMLTNASIDISDDDEDDDSTSTTLDDTDETDEQFERKGRGGAGAGAGNIEAYPFRLTGGSEKRQCNGSTSVSETDTLVGDESLSRLATKQDVNAFHSNALPPVILQRARPHTHEATMAAAAAVARGRSRDIESIYNDNSMGGPSSINSNALSSTTTSTTSTTSTTNSTYSNISTSTNNNNYWLGKNEAMHTLECPDTTINNNNGNSGINQTTTMTTPPSSQSVSSAIPPQTQFSRSAVGGAKFVTNCHPMNPDEYDGLEFESRFESGNLAKAVQITPTYYELYLRPDLYTSRSKQWFYFRVRRTHRKMLYRFSIVNLVKSDSLYNDGMQPVMYSTLGAKEKNEGWRRCGDNICYYRNDDDSGSNSNANEEDEDNSSYTLTFTIEFEHDDDSVYFAHSYPYTYSDLQDYLMEIQRHPVKSKFCKLRLLCRTLAGNNVYYLTVTAPSSNEENMRRKKSIVVSARVHPSETPASWMMKGLMDFITGDTTVAKRLRHKFIFKLVPMLNPDGVIVGNTRNSLTGKDLNRQYRTVIRETYPSIWYTKAMIRRLIEECGVAMYCDMHAHSRKHNIFIYGCENKRNPEKKLTEQVFPLMLHKNSADRFSFESCKFKIQRSKEGTGRIVVWMLGITNSYTIEASFGGSSLGSRKGTHFNTQDYEHMGRAFCETLLDYCDENPNKVKRLSKLFKQIKKIRKREKREQKALKLQKMADQILNLLKQQDRLRSKIIERLMREGSSADEPLNIPLSDYSSDEGNCSSSSDNEGKHSITASDLEGPCCAPTRAPPSSPEVMHEIRKFRMRRMRKVMHELDRIYFTPLFQRKFKALTTLKRQRHKLGCKLPTAKRLRGGGGASQVTAETLSQGGGTTTDVNSLPVRSRQGKRAVQKVKSKSHSRSSESSESSNSSQSQTIINIDNSSRTMPTPPSPTSSMEVKQSMKKRPTTTGGGHNNGNNKHRGKKKKYMPTEKNKIIANHKLYIDRNFRLWLANRKIFIFRRKKNRRIRVRSKSSKKRGDLVRTTLDLPTTDPGSDLHFSTDDEEHSPPSGNANYGQVAPLRHTLLQSELQRRYIEEIGDTVVQKPKPAHMPPELIVTTPSKGNSNGTTGKKIDVYKLTPRTAPELEKVHHSGGVGASGTQTLTARRTYSWHNLDQEVVRSTKQNNSFYETRVPPTASAKAPKVAPPPPRRTVPSNFIPQRPMNSFNQADDLQLKLSLKKKIWTGAQGEPDGRPLAWFRGHQSQVQSQVQAHAASAAAQTAGNRSAGGGASAAPPLRTVSGGGAGGGGGGGVMTNGPPPAFIGASATTATAARKPRKLEQMDLFNACSQKLLQWQQQEDQQQQLPHHQHKKLQQTHQQQQQQRLIGGTNVKLDEQSRYKPLPAAAGSQKKSSSLSANKQIPLTSGPPPPQSTQPSHHHHQHHHHHLDKGKRKSNSLIKIAETTQLVTRFARGNRGSAPGGSSNQQQQQQQQQRLLYKTPTGTVGGMAAGSGGRMHSAGAGMQPAIGRSGGGGLPNKFKTGGLVITAVQQPRNVPGGSRRMRNAAAGIGGGGGIGTTTTTTTTLLQYQRSSHSVQMHKSSTGISLDTVNLVRKVKTKLKKRKSRTLTK